MRQKTKTKLGLIVFFIIIFIGIVIAFNSAIMRLFPLKYRELVSLYSEQFSLDPYLVLAVIKAESNFKPQAISHKNARGLMQITEKTGKWGAETLNLGNYSKEKLDDPTVNINIGCWYLSVLYKEFGDTDLVLAAYNGGSGNVSQWLKDSSLSADGKRLDKIPFKETDKYLKRVKNYYEIYKRLYENEF